MTTKLSELPIHLNQAEIYFIGCGDERDLATLRPALVDGQLNSTGYDLALLFSTANKAGHYRDYYPSLRSLDVFKATVAEMVEIFKGKVEYYTIDNVPEG